MESSLKNTKKKCDKKENIIIKVEKGSIAEELGVEVGDILLSVNGKEIKDVFDYRYLVNDDYIEMLVRDHNSDEEVLLEIEKDFNEDLGIIFESGLMDNARSCANKCIFCFIDQLPKGMRETLYFKDDDSRLSFLQGNYCSLTNMRQEDLDRIKFYHLSPINISVHTTDGDLRKKMLNNLFADRINDYIKQLADAGIDMNFQIVLCRNVNDGKALDKTIEDLGKFIPHAKSLCIVPIGLTKYRDGLYPQIPFDKESCSKVIDRVSYYQKIFNEKYGTNFVYVSDEFYLKAERDFPDIDFYEDFCQYENGVGMIPLMNYEFEEYLNVVSYNEKEEKTVSVATGYAAFDTIKELCDKLSKKFKNIKVNVFKIRNDFFGESITVAGLLTGTDIISQLKGKDLGEYLLLPDALLRNDTETLLDDIEIKDIEKALNIKIKITQNSGSSFINNLLNLED